MGTCEAKRRRKTGTAMVCDCYWQAVLLVWISPSILAYSTGSIYSTLIAANSRTPSRARAAIESGLYRIRLPPEPITGRKVQDEYSDKKQLWHPNFEDYSRAEASVGYDNNTITNVTVQLGATAYLHCRVRSSVDRALGGGDQVSWIRRRDWHILSSGVFTYTNDERFQILHAEGSDDWTLQIKYVQKRDNGTYECQISNSQGIVSHFANLQIVVPEATIQGSRSGEHHVDVGSIIDLVCTIDKSPTPPQYVFWYHNDRMINYDIARGGISVETVPGPPRTESRLTIQDTNDADSGNYTCSASNTDSASIYVFVSEGDNVDAILMRKSGTICAASQLFLLLFPVLFLTPLR